MKKCFVLFMVVILICTLCACTEGRENVNGDTVAGQDIYLEPDSVKAGQPESGDFKFLCSPYSDSACNTENGYYYLTEDVKELRDGNYGSHLMYMDFASCREIYLCSTAGCKHDTIDCPAVFLYDEFPTWTTKLFIFQNDLYILSRDSDEDGTVEQLIEENGLDMVESQPAVLYRAKLDGTERKKIYTFDSELTLEDMIIGDDSGIYFITKKLSTDKVENRMYTTSSERKLIFLNLESLEIKEICSMTFDDDIRWYVMDCYRDSLILNGTDFGRKLSREEEDDQDTYIEMYNQSWDVYAVLDLESGQLREIYREENKKEHSVQIIGDILYVSSADSERIEGITIENGERKEVCTLSQNLIWDNIGDMLCCRDWDLVKDSTYYFVNTKTGEISHSTLVNQCNGWNLEFRAETASDMLVVYDYDATKNSDGSYEIYQYKCALISKEDLFAGKENYRKIQMIEAGQ